MFVDALSNRNQETLYRIVSDRIEIDIPKEKRLINKADFLERVLSDDIRVLETDSQITRSWISGSVGHVTSHQSQKVVLQQSNTQIDRNFSLDCVYVRSSDEWILQSIRQVSEFEFRR